MSDEWAHQPPVGRAVNRGAGRTNAFLPPDAQVASAATRSLNVATLGIGAGSKLAVSPLLGAPSHRRGAQLYVWCPFALRRARPRAVARPSIFGEPRHRDYALRIRSTDLRPRLCCIRAGIARRSLVRLDAGWVAQRGDDSRGVSVEDRAVGHLRSVERQRNVEAVAGAARNDVHVIVRLVLTRGGPAVHDDVQVLTAGHAPD